MHPLVYEPATDVFSSKNMHLDFWSMYLLDVVNFHRFGGPSKHPVVYEPAACVFFSQKTDPWSLGACTLWILSISGELGGHQGWGNLLSGLGESAGRVRGNLPGPPIPTAL